MKAIVCTKYGPPDVLQLKEVEKPAPKNNEVLIKVHAAAVTVSDCIVRSGKVNILLWIPMRIFVGFKRPRKPILGLELSGEIEAIGKDVKRFKKGDQVFAFTGKSFGAFAEYTCLPEDGLCMPADSLVALKPSNMTFEEAATIPIGGLTALRFLKQAGIKKGDNVLIYGASGSVGTFAVQLAKHFGAHVTAVCSTPNVQLVNSLGADHVVDYLKEDFTKTDKKFDIIFDAVGKTSKSACRNLLKAKGRYVSVKGSPKEGLNDLLFLKEIIEEGKLITVIDRRYTLEQIREAHTYVEGHHKKGNVVVNVVGDR